MNITFKKDVSKLHLLETRFSKKAIACAITLSLGVSAFPLCSFAATLIQGYKFMDQTPPTTIEPKRGTEDTALYTKGGYIKIKMVSSTGSALSPEYSTPVLNGYYGFPVAAAGTYKVWQVPDVSDGNISLKWSTEADALIVEVANNQVLYKGVPISSIDFPFPANFVQDGDAIVTFAETQVKTACDKSRIDFVLCGSGITNDECKTKTNKLGGVVIPNTTASSSLVPSLLVDKTVAVYGNNVIPSLTDLKTLCNYGTIVNVNSAIPTNISVKEFLANFADAEIKGQTVSVTDYLVGKKPSNVSLSSKVIVYNEGKILGGSAPIIPTKIAGATMTLGSSTSLNKVSAVNWLSSNFGTPNLPAPTKAGSVTIDAVTTVQRGTILAGQGAGLQFDTRNSATSIWSITNPTSYRFGGAGAELFIGNNASTNSSSSISFVAGASSVTSAGKGGDVSILNETCNSTSCFHLEVKGGKGGNLTLAVNDFNNQQITPPLTKPALSGNSIYIDPSISMTSDININADEDVVIYGGDDYLMKFSGLSANAITAGRKIILATGAGGTIDLRGNNANIFKAGDKVEIFTDNLLLDAGVTIESLVSAPNGVTRSGAKIIYHATISGSSQFTVKAGETINAQLDLRNAGPKVDTYTLKATTQDGVTVNGLPASATVDGLKSAPLDLSIVMPANLSTESTSITITATSQADPSVVATFELRLNVPQTNCAEPATYDTSTRTVSLSKIDIPLLSPIDGKETGEIAVFSAQLEQVSGVEDFKIKPNSLQFLSFSKAYDPSHARYSFNTGLFSNGGLLKTCVAVPQIIVIPPNTPIYTDPKHYLVTLRQLAVSPDTFHVESVDAANP